MSEHEVEFHLVPSALKCLKGTVHDILLCDSIVDDVAHPLGTRLCGKGKTALLHILYLGHNVKGKGVDSKRRQGDVDSLFLADFNEKVQELIQL
jgi:hypothetical protein